MNTRYVDQVYRFSIEIPEYWELDSTQGGFDNKKCRLTVKLSEQAEIKISCAPPGSQTPFEKSARSYFYSHELEETTENVISGALHNVITPISGKDNSVRVELLTRKGFTGIISVFHAGLEYLIHYKSNNSKRDQIESLINSFCLPGYEPIKDPISTKFTHMFTMLDSEKEIDQIEAQVKLVQAGSGAVSALIASINSCNQNIMHSFQTRGIAEQEIAALKRRIEVLGEIRDLQGVNAIIPAIADSVQVQSGSKEAAKLLIAAKEALRNIGNNAVGQIQKSLDLAGPMCKMALVEVLERMGTNDAIKVLRSLANDPDPLIREIVERTIGVVIFYIEKIEAK